MVGVSSSAVEGASSADACTDIACVPDVVATPLSGIDVTPFPDADVVPSPGVGTEVVSTVDVDDASTVDVLDVPAMPVDASAVVAVDVPTMPVLIKSLLKLIVIYPFSHTYLTHNS